MDDASAQVHEECVEFPDNFLLIDLCGEHDRNLAEIENASWRADHAPGESVWP